MICSVGFEFNSLHISLIWYSKCELLEREIACTKIDLFIKSNDFWRKYWRTNMNSARSAVGTDFFLSFCSSFLFCLSLCMLFDCYHLDLYIHFFVFFLVVFFTREDFVMTYHIFNWWFDSFKTVCWSRRKKILNFPLSFKDWRREEGLGERGKVFRFCIH